MLIAFKIKKLVKKFFFSLEEEGIFTTFKKTTRKVIKVFRRTSPDFEQQIAIKFPLENPHPIALQTSITPTVSIIIPVYNNFFYTFNCLYSLSKRVSAKVLFEVIVIDDASSDETANAIRAISGIQVVTNKQNQGFIKSCNRGASLAKGKFLYFLNNDTQIFNNCIESLLETIENDPRVGVVGSQLLYPNGQQQEAGGIIWQDASGWNYGRQDSPDEPEYNYLRPVDYCSGASLLVRTDLFRQLGSFSEEFLPAYYEDTDLCFAIRHLGYKVIYQPRSKIIHHEGITSGTDLSTGTKQYQVVNQRKFQQKWEQVLQGHFTNDAAHVPQGARRLQNKPTILVIDSYVPLYDRESGCVRLFNILKIWLSAGYSVIFLPDNGNPEEPYTSKLQQMGIEVIYYTPKQSDLKAKLLKQLPLIDVVWLCRPELCDQYLELIRFYSKVPIIYDTIDLHFLRLKRQQDFFDKTYQNTNWSWETYQKLEINYARQADATIVVTDVEKQTLSSLGIDNIWVIPNIHDPIHFTKQVPFEKREGLVFIGSYNHPPNIDAVKWLCLEIMPLVWEFQPDIKVTLLGSNLKDEVRDLASERVIITGYVEEVEPYFLENRVFVAPLRFGAGMKGKIGQSMSFGLPTVTTTIGAEGIGLKDRDDVLIADDAESLAQSILELYNDEELWNTIANNSLETIERYTPSKVQEKLDELFINLKVNR